MEVLDQKMVTEAMLSEHKRDDMMKMHRTAKHLKKGDWVTVTGVPSLRKYEKRDGSEGTSLEVEVNDWGFCGPKPAPSSQSYNNDAPSPDIPF